MFHKLTSQHAVALQEGDTKLAKSSEKSLEEMGGRKEYQRASQLSTSFHSTSRWVLGYLANNGWLYGIKKSSGVDHEVSNSSSKRERGKNQAPRRKTKILEVGAINTELLDAAEVESDNNNFSSLDLSQSTQKKRKHKYNIHVRAIDIHSMEERIEEVDFLQLPKMSPKDSTQRLDVIVCSMVLNCVTTPSDRGKMLALLYHQLRPGGLCFLTLPKSCLTKSAFLTPLLFQKMLGSAGVGFEIKSTKDSPKVSFFILERPVEEEYTRSTTRLNPTFTQRIIRNKGKKFPNQFSVILQVEHVFGTGTLEGGKTKQNPTDKK